MTLKENHNTHMTTKLARQRVAVLVDCQNLFYAARDKGARPDFERILQVVNGREIIRALVYAIEPENADVTGFFRALERMGYEIRHKPAKRLPDGSLKADWDMGLAIDALALADKVDVIVLLSGDGDFVPLVHALRAKGVKVECMAVPGSVAKELVSAVDSYQNIAGDMLIVKHTSTAG